MGLGLSRHRKGGPVLTSCLRDADARVKLASASGLRHVKHGESVFPLIKTLLTDDKTLKSKVADALTFQTGKNLGEDYALWKGWYDNR